MSYTVIGDNVNLGARLESLNKEYGTRILISEATRARLKRTIRRAPAGRGRGEGQDPAGRIFEVASPLVKTRRGRRQSPKEEEHPYETRHRGRRLAGSRSPCGPPRPSSAVQRRVEEGPAVKRRQDDRRRRAPARPGQSATSGRDRYGVVQDAASPYVTLVGLALRRPARARTDWKFIVLDTDAVNAFAAPGGFIHITKGALASERTNRSWPACSAMRLSTSPRNTRSGPSTRASWCDGGRTSTVAAAQSADGKGAQGLQVIENGSAVAMSSRPTRRASCWPTPSATRRTVMPASSPC